MSESFEERQDGIAENETDEEESFEGSTVFSAPEEKNDKVEKPKLLKKILIGLGAIAVLVGIIVGIVLLVEKISDEDSGETIVEYYVLESFTSVDEYNGDVTFDYKAVSKLDFKSEKVTLSFYSKLPEEEDEAASWYESSIPEEYTDESTVSTVAQALLSMKYTRLISDSVKEGVDYGFETPLYTAVITPYEGESFTLTVGKLAADQSGYYVTDTKSGKVFLVRSTYLTSLAVEDRMELTQALTVSAFSEGEGSAQYYNSGSLTTFDHLYFENKVLGKRYKFITADGSTGQEYNTYMISEPISRRANDTGIVPIIELFSTGITSQGLYSVTCADEDIKKYGLDDPDVAVSIKAGSQEREIKAKLQDDGYYALIASDYEVVLKVSASALSVASLEEKDIFSTFLFIESLADADTFTLKSDTVNHSFKIVTEIDEEDESKTIVGISIDGKETSAPEEFQSYYQFILGIKTLAYEASDLSGKSPEATITMTKADGSSSTVIDYYAVENGRYQVVVNGNQMGKIGSSSFKNILKYAENVVAGKVYNS